MKQMLQKPFTQIFFYALFIGAFLHQPAYADIFEDIFQDFEDTWTIINDEIQPKVDQLKESVQTLTGENFDALFQSTWTQLQCFTDIRISNQITISSPGSYCVTRDITASSGDVITVDASDVVINMQGHTLSATSGNGIVVSSGNSRIMIRDGFVRNCSDDGIVVEDTTDIVGIINVRATECENGLVAQADGLLLKDCSFSQNTCDGAYLNGSTNSKVIACDFCDNTTGLALDTTDRVIVSNCQANENSIAGFALDNAQKTVFRSCSAFKNGNGGDAFGFVSVNGTSNLFVECLADQTQTNTVANACLAAGFYLTTTESRSSIIRCNSNNTFSDDGGSTVAYGIRLHETNKCMVLENTVYGTTAGPGGIGYSEERTTETFNNLFLKNLAYCNDLNYSSSIMPVYDDGLEGWPSIIDNLCFPPLEGSDPFNDTFTTIDGLNEIFCNKFDDTFTIIATLTAQSVVLDFDPIFTALDDITETLCTKFEQTWTVIEDIKTLVNNEFCNATYITQDDIGSTYVISTTGRYVFAENLFFSNSTGPAISIESADVTLDLNGKTLVQTVATGNISGIELDDDVSGIVIHDGTIKGFSTGASTFVASAITTGSGCSDITIEDIDIVEADGQGITINGIAAAPCHHITIRNCRMIELMQLLEAGSGIFIDESFNICIENCQVVDCGSLDIDDLNGISLQNCESFFVNNCQVMGCIDDDRVICFRTLDECSNGQFTNCTASNNEAGTTLNGFLFGGQSSGGRSANIVAENCCVLTNTIALAQPNGSQGFQGFTILDSDSCAILDCTVINNHGNQRPHIGFLIDDSGGGTPLHNLISKCIAVNGQNEQSSGSCDGFHITTDCDECAILDSISLRMTNNAFAQVRGFFLGDPTECLIKGCIALYNEGANFSSSVYGFRKTSSATTDNNFFMQNKAIRNITSSSGATNQFFNVPAAWVENGTIAAPPTFLTGGAATMSVNKFEFTNLGVV